MVTTETEMRNSFVHLAKYIKAKGKDSLVLRNSGGNRYVVSIKMASGGYDDITSHLTKGEMATELWDFSRVLSKTKLR
jgi:hypothetical protein